MFSLRSLAGMIESMNLRGLVSGAVRHGIHAGTDLLYPPACSFCGVDIAEPADEIQLCLPCRSSLLNFRGARCRACGCELPPGFLDDQTSCANCRDEKFKFSSVMAAAAYRDDARDAVLRMKFSGSHGLAIAVSQLLLQTMKSQFERFAPTVVAPIPMHWTRRLWRGTNCPETIAEHLADGLNVPFAPDLLVRIRKTQRQTFLPPGQRQENVRGAFRPRKGYDLADLRVLLVDDVLTTGATCNEAAKVLLAARAQAVAVAVIARALSWS